MPALSGKFLSSRTKFLELDNLNIRRKQIGDNFSFSIYYDFDDETVNIRFAYKDERELERHLLDGIEEEENDVGLDKLGKTPDKSLPSQEINDDEH